MLNQIKSILYIFLLGMVLFLSSADAAPKATQAQVDALQAEVQLLQQQIERQSRVDLSAGLHIIQRRLQNMERELQDLRESNQRLRRQLSKLEKRQRGVNSEVVQAPRKPSAENSSNSNSVFSSSVDWASVVSSDSTLSNEQVEISGNVTKSDVRQSELSVRNDDQVSSTVVQAETKQESVSAIESVANTEEKISESIHSEVIIDGAVIVNGQEQIVGQSKNKESIDEATVGQRQDENNDKAITESKVAVSVMRETQDSSETTNAYRDAFLLLKQGRYIESIEAFQQFLSGYPNSKYTANAQYWLAEAVYARKQYDQALIEFTKVVEDYPMSSKVSDARLKVGYTFYELGRWKESREILTQLRAELPDSTVAGLAQQRLERLEREGR
ncbi:MAG: tol-pal system protein YbgF [Gammaproteobacteria bacterium]|nr:tol-pal system protein YbgF [Gammaproteobacteria bacterium]